MAKLAFEDDTFKTSKNNLRSEPVAIATFEITKITLKLSRKKLQQTVTHSLYVNGKPVSICNYNTG